MSKEKNVVLERILSDFGIKDGKIKLGEEVKDINELEPDVQYNILKNIITNKNKDEIQLSEDEISSIKFLREKKTTLNEFLNNEVLREVSKAKQFYELDNQDFDKMSDDMIYIKSLKEKNKDITDEELNRKVETAKSLEGFSDIANDLREVFKTKKELDLEKIHKEEQTTFNDNLEKQRKFITDKVVPIDYISDWKVTDETKNELLEKILEVVESEDGTVNSIFIDEITSDPEKLIKAAHNYYKGDELFNQLNTYHQMEKAKAVEEAKKTALDGTDINTERVPFSETENKASDDDGNKDEGEGHNFGEE